MILVRKQDSMEFFHWIFFLAIMFLHTVEFQQVKTRKNLKQDIAAVVKTSSCITSG